MTYFDRILTMPKHGTDFFGFIFYGICMNINAKCTVEIGVAGGYISSWLTHAMAQTKGMHYAIDINQKSIDNYRKLMRSYNYLDQYTKTIRDDSLNIPWNKKIDFMFIDGEHSEEQVTAEINKYKPYIRKGGYIAFHDYLCFDGVKKSCDTLLSDNTWEKIILEDTFKVKKGVLLCRLMPKAKRKKIKEEKKEYVCKDAIPELCELDMSDL